MAIIHYLLIGGMVGVGYWDGFHMVSALVYIVSYTLDKTYESHDMRLSSSHDFIKLFHCVVSQP